MTRPADELLEVVDEKDHVVGVVPRREMRDRRLLHRCTYVLVLNAARDLYVHRRTDTKDIYPSFFDVTAGGVNAVGESYDDGAAREVEEELGVSVPPQFRFRFRYSGPDGEAWGAVYDVVWDGAIRWQPEEVVWGAFLPFDEVDAMIAREPFCPDGLEAFARWREGKLAP